MFNKMYLKIYFYLNILHFAELILKHILTIKKPCDYLSKLVNCSSKLSNPFSSAEDALLHSFQYPF